MVAQLSQQTCDKHTSATAKKKGLADCVVPLCMRFVSPRSLSPCLPLLAPPAAALVVGVALPLLMLVMIRAGLPPYTLGPGQPRRQAAAHDTADTGEVCVQKVSGIWPFVQ